MTISLHIDHLHVLLDGLSALEGGSAWTAYEGDPEDPKTTEEGYDVLVGEARERITAILGADGGLVSGTPVPTRPAAYLPATVDGDEVHHTLTFGDVPTTYTETLKGLAQCGTWTIQYVTNEGQGDEDMQIGVLGAALDATAAAAAIGFNDHYSGSVDTLLLVIYPANNDGEVIPGAVPRFIDAHSLVHLHVV